MNAATQQLGHPPAKWVEFRATVVNVQLDANTMKYADSFNRELDNAEATGGAI